MTSTTTNSKRSNSTLNFKPVADYPDMMIARSEDFATSGEYQVSINGTTHIISRDPSNGWWYEDLSGKHFSECVIGFNKREALAQMYAKHFVAPVVVEPKTNSEGLTIMPAREQMTQQEIREAYLYTIPADSDGVHGTPAQRLAFGNAYNAGDSLLHWMSKKIHVEDIYDMAREAAHYAFEALPDLRVVETFEDRHRERVERRRRAAAKKISPSSVEICNGNYQHANGTSPRGYGRWAFGVKPITDALACQFFTGTLTSAKQAARKWAASQNIETLFLQS
jgi:hypothetical protein